MFYFLWLALDIYQWLLVARVMMSWFPDFSDQPWFRLIASVTDPYLNLFRGLIPPIAQTIDLSPMIAFFVLYWIRASLTQLM